MSVSPLERIDARSPLVRLTALADADSFNPLRPPMIAAPSQGS